MALLVSLELAILTREKAEIIYDYRRFDTMYDIYVLFFIGSTRGQVDPMCERHYVDPTMLMTWSKNHVDHKCTLNVDVGFFLSFLFQVSMQPPDRWTGMSFGHCQYTMGPQKNNFDLDRGPMVAYMSRRWTGRSYVYFLSQKNLILQIQNPITFLFQFWQFIMASGVLQILFSYHNQFLFTTAGIWAGMRTVRYFDGRTYEWVGISRQPNIIGKVCSVRSNLYETSTYF